MKRVLLTGASGFIGGWTLRRLLEDPDIRVGALLRPSASLWRVPEVESHPRFTRLTGDLYKLPEAEWTIRNFGPATMIHLAWDGVGNKDRNNPNQIQNQYIALCLVALADKAKVSTFIGLGSQAEYGPHAGKMDENTPVRPTTLYGMSKLSTCLFTGHYCARWNIRFAWLRLFSSYGPGDDPGWMIPYLILELLKGKKPSLTAGEQLWDYIHASDVANAIYSVVKTDTASGVFNLGSGTAPPLKKTVEMIRDAIDPALPLGFGEVPYRPDQVMHLEADTQRLQAATGWKPKIELAEGLKQTVDWYRENIKRYASVEN